MTFVCLQGFWLPKKLKRGRLENRHSTLFGTWSCHMDSAGAVVGCLLQPRQGERQQAWCDHEGVGHWLSEVWDDQSLALIICMFIVIYIFYLTICGAFVANFLGCCTLSSSYHSMGITSSNQGAWLTATGATYMKSISAWAANLLRSCMSDFKWKPRASMGSFHGALILRGHRAATSSHSDAFGHGGKACGKWQYMKPAAYSFLQFHAVCFWQC